MLAAVGVVLLKAVIQAQQTVLPPSMHRSGPPVPAMAQIRNRMKQFRDRQAEQLAGEIGPPPGECQVDVSHIEDDDLGEGLAEFVADIFTRDYWHVEVSPSEQLSCASPGIIVQFSAPAATAAAKLQAALSYREDTAITPIWPGDPHSCGLHITVGPQ